MLSSCYICCITEFQSLLKDEVVPCSPDEQTLVISEEMTPLPFPPLSFGNIIIVQVAGTTLNKAHYKAILRLTSSHFFLPTGALEYVGHTLNPLTLYWNCSRQKRVFNSFGIYTEMAEEGVLCVMVGILMKFIIPTRDVSNNISDRPREKAV